MKMVCVLNEWQCETVDRGRFKGQESKFRYVLAVDNWNWMIADQRKDANAPMTGYLYYPSMRIFLPRLLERSQELGIKVEFALPNIVQSLQKLTGKQVSMPIGELTVGVLEKFGKQLDDEMNLSYVREYPPTVCQRLFGAAEPEEVAV
jgi:hypothetical protein